VLNRSLASRVVGLSLQATGYGLCILTMLLADGCASPAPQGIQSPAANPPLNGENSSIYAPVPLKKKAAPRAGAGSEQAARRPGSWPVMKLVPGDEIEINFFGAPELNTMQAIRRDGKISLQLVGEIMAAGKFPEELQDELRALYGKELQIKDVSVILRVPPSVLVSGSVLVPGRVPLNRPLTVLDAIMEAGGFDPREAETKKVVLIRQEKGKYKGAVYNFKKALKGGKNNDTYYLQPFDIVYVPRTTIARLNQWVDQYINEMIPSLGWSYNPDEGATLYR